MPDIHQAKLQKGGGVKPPFGGDGQQVDPSKEALEYSGFYSNLFLVPKMA